MMQADVRPAREAGLTLRLLEATIVDTLAWDRAAPGDRPAVRTEGARSLRPTDRSASLSRNAGLTARRSGDLDERPLPRRLAVEGQPYVIPTLHARVGDNCTSGFAAAVRRRHAESGAPARHRDALRRAVLAKSVFNHSVNYRSAVVFGTAMLVDGDEKARRCARSLSSSRPAAEEARQPTDQELSDLDPRAASRRGFGEGTNRRRRMNRDADLPGAWLSRCLAAELGDYDWRRASRRAAGTAAVSPRRSGTLRCEHLQQTENGLRC